MSQQTVPEWARLPVGTGPVGIAIVDLDKQLGLDIVVLNSRPSAGGLAQFVKAIDAAASKSTTTATASARLAALKGDLAEKYATISVLYGAREARFWRAYETLLYKEVGANRPTSSGGTERYQEAIACRVPTALVAVNRDKDRMGLLALGSGSPYIFNWRSTGTGTSGPVLDSSELNVLNWDVFYGAGTLAKGSESVQDLQFAAGPCSVAVGDFDGGDPSDLAVADRNTYTLTVYSGLKVSGTGVGANFFRTYPTGEETTPLWECTIGKAGDEPYFVAASDLNGDGRDDLVVAMGGILSTGVAVLCSNGDGTFSWPQQKNGPFVRATKQPRSVAIDDFDRDGIAEIVVAGLEELVLLDRGADGTYGAPRSMGTLTGTGDSKLDPPFGMVVGDFNGDRREDLAVANIGNDSVDVYLGNGDGTFRMEQVKFSAEDHPIALAAGDLNEDGGLDLAVALNGANEVAILLGKDASEGPVFERWLHPALGSGVSALATGNLFNYEDRTDLAVARTSLAATVVTGKSVTDTPIPFSFVSDDVITQYLLVQPLVAAFDMLGSSPSVTSSSVLGQVSVLPGGLDGSFAVSQPGRKLDAGPYATLATGDWAEPGEGAPLRQQLVISSIEPKTGTADALGAQWLRSIWVWNLSVEKPTQLKLAPEIKGAKEVAVDVQGPPLPPMRPRALAVVDVNGDGHTDLVYADSKAGRVYVLTRDLDAATAAATAAVDAAGTSSTEREKKIAEETAMRAFRYTRPASESAPAFASPDWCATGRQPSAIAAADFDGDGQVELAVANAGSNSVSILENVLTLERATLAEGQPTAFVTTLALKSTILVGSTPMAIVAADLNDDGSPDLAVANFGADSVSILWNDTLGNFTRRSEEDIKVGRGPIALALAYSNENGEGFARNLTGSTFPSGRSFPELVVANFLSNDISVLATAGGTLVEKILGDGDAAYDVMKNEVRPAKSDSGAPSVAFLAIGSGPVAVSVGFFDDFGKPARTLDVAVGFEFPTAPKSGSDAVKTLWRDVFILYGPKDFGGSR
jgi:hypothetical protein